MLDRGRGRGGNQLRRCGHCRGCGGRATRLDLAQLLAAVENAPPVAAADVLGGGSRPRSARRRSRFSSSTSAGVRSSASATPARRPATRTQGRETAERVAARGQPARARAAPSDVEVERGRRRDAPVRAGDQSRRGDRRARARACPRRPDEQTLADVALAAHALAYVVIANRRFTDLFEWGQRSVRLSLAAEIQHRLLPGAFTCEGGQFTLAAWLEPAGEIAGDSFDFSIERDTLHLSMTDARGHAVGASILATLLVGALRNARRAGVGLAEQARLRQRGARRARAAGATSSPGSSRASTCAAGPRRSSTPATSRRCACATARVEAGRAARRPAVRARARPRLPGAAAAAAAGRPADVPHRRHARAQRGARRHPRADGRGRGACTRARPSSTSCSRC